MPVSGRECGAIVRAEPLVRLLVLLTGLCALYGWLRGNNRPVAPQPARPDGPLNDAEEGTIVA